jgi:hypothetical protein
VSEPNLCPLRTIAYQPGCSTVAVRSRSSLDTGDETADVGEVVRQANVGHAAEGLEELIVGGDSNRAGPRGLEIVPSRVGLASFAGVSGRYMIPLALTGFSYVSCPYCRMLRSQ